VAQAIIGLGNPGPEYKNTRHNVGQRVVDALARRLHARLAREGAHQVASAEWGDHHLHLIKPGSFMNVSGPVIARLSKKLRLDSADLIIVFDDLDLPLGTVRMRMKGSAGGHNGMRSVIETLGTDAIRRVKVGIGRPGTPGQDRDRVVDHVLSPFYPDEHDAIEAACATAADMVLKLVESYTRPPTTDA